MKLKRLLAAILSLVMLLGTMGTVAFAEEAEVDVWDGTVDTSWYNDTDTEFTITTAEQWAGLAELVDGGTTFADKTIKLGQDLDLASISFNPIGHSANGKSFNGIFDGQNHTISNLYQQSNLDDKNGGWLYEGEYYGLFAYTNGATMKDVTVEGAYISSGRNEAAGLVGNAVDTQFSGITISNTTLIAYNNSAGGVASECYGVCSFTDILVDEDTVIGPLWGTYDVRLGGVVGMVKSSDKVSFKNVTVECKLDAINDVAANYQYWLYRYCGMLIGQVDDVNGVADPTGYVTCDNVKVTIGEWANYHYCEFARLGAGSYNGPGEYKYARVEAGTGTDGIDLSACNHAEDESHNVLIAFGQLFGGGQGVSGLTTFDGVNVIDKAKEARTVAELYKYSDVAREATPIYVDSYATLQEAVDAAKEGEYLIEVLKDIELDNSVIISGKNVTIDGNGFSLTVKDIPTGRAKAAFDVKDNAVVTFKDIDIAGGSVVDENGTIQEGVAGAAIVATAATVKVDNANLVGGSAAGVSMKSAASAIKAEGATINVLDSTLTGGESQEIPAPVIDIEDTSTLSIHNVVLNYKTTSHPVFPTDIGVISGQEGAVLGAEYNTPIDMSGKVVINGRTFDNVSIIVPDGEELFLEGDIDTASIDLETNYEFDRTANGFAVVPTEKLADTISIVYKDITGDAEGKKVYQIFAKANNGDMINEFASAELTFANTSKLLNGKDMPYVIEAADNMTLSTKQGKPDYYGFSMEGDDEYEIIGNEVLLGTVTFEGYGDISFATDPAGKNIVNATTVHDNLVDYYVVGGDVDDKAETGGLIINTDIDNVYVGDIDGVTIAVPVRDLAINIKFPNAVANQSKAYQEMKVVISGGDLKENIEIKLGEDWAATGLEIAGKVDADCTVTYANNAYAINVIKALTLNNAYTVTVSGAGYRTARYTVTMTEAKTLNFWNNVMDEDTAVEEGVFDTTKNFLAGDIVKDNNINIYDLSAVVSYFGTDGINTQDVSDYAKYDLNRDGIIDSRDVAYVLVSWGE